MAAAASAEPVSPELALVDAALAEQLRTIEAPALYVVPSPPASSEADQALGEAVEPELAAPLLPVDEYDPIADLIVREPESRVAERPTFDTAQELASTDDLVAEASSQHAETSWYPALPAPADDRPEAMDATETALREIRDRLATPGPVKRRRRFRRRFTIASGLSTAVVLGVFAANVGYGVTQLPL